VDPTQLLTISRGDSIRRFRHLKKEKDAGREGWREGVRGGMGEGKRVRANSEIESEQERERASE